MSKFVYVTYIQTTPEKLWEALIKPEFTKQYWMGVSQISDWKVGSSWNLQFSDGRVADTGEVLEIDPPRRLVVSWQNEFRQDLKEEGHSRATFDIAMVGKVVMLTVTHEIAREGSKLIEAVSGGWPAILSGLKTLLETGKVLEGWPS
ncbi:MAG: SRPBCC family protein [Rhizomicrobium sp.]|jgi:uncharacterized protein YndB with AHSA1/START domain